MGYQHLKYTSLLLLCAASSLEGAAHVHSAVSPFHRHFHVIIDYGVTLLLFLTVVIIVRNRLFLYRQRKVRRHNLQQISRLSAVIQSANLGIWTYDVRQNRYYLLSNDGKAVEQYNAEDYMYFFEHESFNILTRAVNQIADGVLKEKRVSLRLHTEVPGVLKYYEVDIVPFLRDHQGRVASVLCVRYNVTEAFKQQEQTNQLYLLYHTIFQSTIVDMAYVDKEGYLTDVNENACRTYGVKDYDVLISARPKVSDNPLFDFIDFETTEPMLSTSIIDFKNYHPEHTLLDNPQQKGRMYYEVLVAPIYNERGEKEGCYLSGRNVMEVVNSFHLQQASLAKLEETRDRMLQYIKEINYSLRVTGVRLLNYYPDEHTLEIFADMNRPQYRISQLRTLRLIAPQDQPRMVRLLNRMDRRVDCVMRETVETIMRDDKGRAIVFYLNIMPIYDEEGRITHYFGMSRNQTDIVETERRLAAETKRAQEVEKVKEVFLTNMSHEIRTPLNTVVGFAELFETEHSPEDEPIFVEEIKRNSNLLLELINDILFLSRLDANMVEYNKTFVDFVPIFDSYCRLGWSSVSPNVKTVLDNPYDQLLINVDQNHLGIVIQRLCAFSAMFTQQGTVSAKYEYHGGTLQIVITDTGVGIDAETLPRVFDRFVRNMNDEKCGLGLGLPIVQTLVRQMGGTIDMQSELEQGTTVWIMIPCEAATVVRKKEY